MFIYHFFVCPVYAGDKGRLKRSAQKIKNVLNSRSRKKKCFCRCRKSYGKLIDVREKQKFATHWESVIWLAHIARINFFKELQLVDTKSNFQISVSLQSAGVTLKQYYQANYIIYDFRLQSYWKWEFPASCRFRSK